MKTEQEIFDQVAKHLLKQMKKSYLPGSNVCAYRGEQGAMCAVGCLLTEYDEAIEDKHISAVIVDYPEIAQAAGITSNNCQLLADLQRLHDRTEVKHWYYELSRIAKSYALDPKVLIEVAIC